MHITFKCIAFGILNFGINYYKITYEPFPMSAIFPKMCVMFVAGALVNAFGAIVLGAPVGIQCVIVFYTDYLPIWLLII